MIDLSKVRLSFIFPQKTQFNIQHMKHLIYLSSLMLLLACTENNPTIVQTEFDLGSYEEAMDKKIESVDKRLEFWNQKLQSNPGNTIYLQKVAALQAQKFKTTKSIELLDSSDEILASLHKRNPSDVGVIHSSIANAISRHAFQDALNLAREAIYIGEKKDQSKLLLVDVLIEQGLFIEARELLEGFPYPERFDNQIRWVKLFDAEGDLDTAVQTMEAALANANEMNQLELIVWSLGNLADMYGHQGRIEKSYSTYLQALAYDPADSHSLKGIGWIMYSHDKELEKAKNFYTDLYKVLPDPALEILLAEISEMQGDVASSITLRNKLTQEFSKASYGNMYGAFLINEYFKDQPAKSLDIAEKDIAQREHPMSYAYLALAELGQGNSNEAEKLILEKVIGHTEEPMALYLTGFILDETGNESPALHYLEAANEASYELGPLIQRDIIARLNIM